MSNNNTTLYILGAAAVAAVFLLPKHSGTAANTTTSTGSGAGANTPIDAAGTLQKDIVNGVSNYSTQIANHPELSDRNYIMTQAQRAQLLANYKDLQQGMAVWVQESPELGNVYNAVQKFWTEYGNNDKRTFFALIPSSNTPYAGPPAQPKSSGGGFWSGLLSVATSVAPLILAGSVQPAYPQLSDNEIDCLVNGSAIVKEILPFFKGVQPDYVFDVDSKIDELVNYYGSKQRA